MGCVSPSKPRSQMEREMADIKIIWTSDDHECETCGTSWADGATVWIDGRKALELKPVAHCLGGAHYSERDVFTAILFWLGHTVLGETSKAEDLRAEAASKERLIETLTAALEEIRDMPIMNPVTVYEIARAALLEDSPS